MSAVPTIAPDVDVDVDLAHLDEDLFLDAEEGRRQFDALVESRLGISGREFIKRFDGGEFQHVADDEAHRDIVELAMLIPFGRQVGSTGGRSRC